jgi:hypothetical protein
MLRILRIGGPIVAAVFALILLLTAPEGVVAVSADCTADQGPGTENPTCCQCLSFDDGTLCITVHASQQNPGPGFGGYNTCVQGPGQVCPDERDCDFSGGQT